MLSLDDKNHHSYKEKACTRLWHMLILSNSHWIMIRYTFGSFSGLGKFSVESLNFLISLMALYRLVSGRFLLKSVFQIDGYQN